MPATLIWSVTTILFATGVVGIFIPALPGVGLVFAGVLFYALATDFATISITTVVVLGVVALLAWMSDYFGAAVGARLGGGRKYTMIGLVAGAVLGLLVGGPPGLVLGALAGAVAGAMYEGKNVKEAGKAAVFSFLGIIGARILQLALAIVTIIAFFVALAV